jgi:hypothetical protein
MEFEENFIPHITAKPLVKTEIVETKQPVYSGSEMVTTEATTSTATNPAPTPAPKKFRGSIKVEFGTVNGEASETGIRFVKSERRHYRANRIGTGGKPEKVSAN